MSKAYVIALSTISILAPAVWASDSVAAKYDPSKYSQVVTACDRLAAHTEDPNKVSPGLSESAVNLPAAIAACRADVAKDPANPRLSYQLGRALAYDGQIDESLPNLEKSVTAAYPQAQFVLGYLLLDGRLKAPVDRCRALSLFRLSAAQGRMAAQIGLVAWHLEGDFDTCADRPKQEELLELLIAARAQKPKFYPELLISDLERQVRTIR